MTLQTIHQGGFVWRLPRSERDAALLRLAADVGQLVLVTRTESEARYLAERLTLSGLPVRVATEPGEMSAAELFALDDVTSLVVTHDFIVEAGPLAAAAVVHTRIPNSARRYMRRLSAAQAPVHITLVLPEDESAAAELFPQLVAEDGERVEPLDVVLDLTATDRPAAIAGRRRFPLVR